MSDDPVLVVYSPRSRCEWAVWSQQTVKEILEWCKHFRDKSTELSIIIRETRAHKSERWNTDVAGLAAYAHARLAKMNLRKKKFLKAL